MAVEDATIQNFLFYKIGSLCAISGVIWYFRKAIMYYTYQRCFAWVIDRFTAGLNKALFKDKTKLFERVHEYQEQLDYKDLNILEVGSGSAANLEFFPSNTKLVCLDPNPHFVGYIKNNLKKHDTVISAEIVQGYAEELPFANESFDVVVCTLVLCSVHNVERSLDEMKRVLKPGGMCVFMEHVAAEKNTWTWKLQCVMSPLHWYIGDCNLKLDTGKFIKAAGFSDVRLESIYAKKLFVWIRPFIVGTAFK